MGSLGKEDYGRPERSRRWLRNFGLVDYSLSGPGEIIAVGNGDPTGHESFQALKKRVFNGMALVVIRSRKGESGGLRLTTQSEGLSTATIKLETTPSGHDVLRVQLQPVPCRR